MKLKFMIASLILSLGSIVSLVAGEIADCCPQQSCCPKPCPNKCECPKPCCPKPCPKPCCPKPCPKPCCPPKCPKPCCQPKPFCPSGDVNTNPNYDNMDRSNMDKSMQKNKPNMYNPNANNGY